MSLWWVTKDQLDDDQVGLIEGLPLRDSSLILGPPGCGKTNVLLRRAQFVRGQDMPNVFVLTFTRALTEFVRTGCIDEQGRTIFPRNRVNTVESWVRSLYGRHDAELPERPNNLIEWKRRLAQGALGFAGIGRVPRYDALFIDEAQDLIQEEVDLVAAWSDVLFLLAMTARRYFLRQRVSQPFARSSHQDANAHYAFIIASPRRSAVSRTGYCYHSGIRASSQRATITDPRPRQLRCNNTRRQRKIN